MADLPVQEIADRAFTLGLLDERDLQQIWSELGTRVVSADDFLQLCVRREYLTNYQVERLVGGEKTGFFFGDYKALYFMGAGSFARVYRAVHKDTGQVVALKVLRKRFSDSASQYGLFVREGELGCTLRHPNVVPVYEVFSRRGLHFLVMEFVEGQNLRDFLKIRKKVNAEEATRLMTDIAKGLAYAFDLGLTHRDLKLTNVLVSSRGQAKLVDFGLAAIEDGMARGDAWVEMSTRTIDYAALERATGVRKDDTRSDLYFMGCIYYHMLAGHAPLTETRDRAKRLSRQRLEEVAPIQQIEPSVPNAVAMVINRAMTLDPDRRYQTPKEMLADLENAARRMEEGTANEEPAQVEQREPAAAPEQEVHHSVMVVEARAPMQDLFRKSLKKAGFRVLLTSDPDRAVERLREDAGAADGVLLNAQGVGQAALEAFNKLGDDPKTRHVPAMLLLDEGQRAWSKAAKKAEHRKVISMPITMKDLRAELVKLVS